MPVPAALGALYGEGIAPDWWKLPPAQDAATWSKIAEVNSRQDASCRGFVILGLNATDEDLGSMPRTAARPVDVLPSGGAFSRSPPKRGWQVKSTTKRLSMPWLAPIDGSVAYRGSVGGNPASQLGSKQTVAMAKVYSRLAKDTTYCT